MLRNGIADICVKEGEATQSVADQDKIKALFPNTYGELSLIHIFTWPWNIIARLFSVVLIQYFTS